MLPRRKLSYKRLARIIPEYFGKIGGNLFNKMMQIIGNELKI